MESKAKFGVDLNAQGLSQIMNNDEKIWILT